MDTLKKIGIFILSVALLIFTTSFLIAVYHSVRRVSGSDIEPVEKSLQKVQEALKESDTPRSVLDRFTNDNARLQADVQVLGAQGPADGQLRQAAIRDMNDVVIDLTALQNQWGRERGASSSAVSESLAALKALRERLEPTASFEKVVGLVLTWLAGLAVGAAKLLVMLAWPIVVVLIFLYLFRSKAAPARLKQLLENVKSLEFFSAKLQLGDEVKATLEETFARYRKEVRDKYDQAVKKKSLDDKLKSLLSPESKIMKEIDAARKASDQSRAAIQDYRCTLHVPDLLFAETFYQLVEYFPRVAGEEKRGRTWSYRFGFIGRAWRLETSDMQGTVSTNLEDLIDGWGMTKGEAEAAGKDRKSFMAVLLRHNAVPVGLFYMDSKEEHAFGPKKDTRLFDCVEGELKRLEIIKDLAAIREDLSGQSPKIKIYTER